MAKKITGKAAASDASKVLRDALFNLIFAVKLNDSMKPLSIYNLSSC